MQRELSSFPLPPNLRGRLQDAGFTTVEDLQGLKPAALSEECNVTREEALEIITTVFGQAPSGGSGAGCDGSKSALELLQDERCTQTVVTFCEQLDGMLGGGIPVGKITELCGAPGIGKTQICMQLCMSVQVPEYLGGLGGEAVFIDTEGSFLVDRLVDMAMATADHCHQVAAALQAQGQMPDDVEAPVENLTRDNLLKGVHYFRCHDYVQLLALMHILPDFLKAHTQVRVVVIDSIAFHFRHDFPDLALRTRLLNGLAQDAGKMAAHYHVAVVLTNQMTTRMGGGDGGENKGWQLVPALGESWGHAATLRLVLHWRHHTRQATLYKSPSSPETTVPYQITMGGVRDISEETDNDLPNRPQPLSNEVSQPMKRARLDDL